jgi:heptosyltransferase-2
MKIPLLRWADRLLGWFILLPVGLVTLLFPKKKLETKRILVIKLWAMGESILTLPLIRAIKKKYPKAVIDVLCHSRVKDVYTGSKDIANVRATGIFGLMGLMFSKRTYDIAIDCEPYLNCSSLLAWKLARRRIGFKHGIRSLLYTDRVRYNDEQHITLTYLDMGAPLGIEDKPERLIPIATSRKDEKRVDELFKDWGIKPTDLLVCINPGAAESSKSRTWPAKRFAKVADAMVKEYLAKIVIIGAKTEHPEAEKVAAQMHYTAINAAGQTSMKELAVLLKRCALTISNDTGPVHLSPAMGTPTIGLFCPNTPVRWAPYGPGNASVYKPILPKPCINTHKGQLPECKNHKHMSLIKSKDVIEQARRMLYARRH